jgi:hypothetical protein
LLIGFAGYDETAIQEGLVRLAKALSGQEPATLKKSARWEEDNPAGYADVEG